MTEDILNAMGVKEIITPDGVRTKGITGNMLANQCHSNAAYLAKRYGGKRDSGFLILPNDDGYDDYLHHSIWLTPEGKYTEVTLKENRRFAITEERRYGDPSFTPGFNFAQIERDKWLLVFLDESFTLSSREMLNWTADLYKGCGSLKEELSVGLLSLSNDDRWPPKQSFTFGDRWDDYLHSDYRWQLEQKQKAVGL